jgi:hypothetical protein
MVPPPAAAINYIITIELVVFILWRDEQASMSAPAFPTLGWLRDPLRIAPRAGFSDGTARKGILNIGALIPGMDQLNRRIGRWQALA